MPTRWPALRCPRQNVHVPVAIAMFTQTATDGTLWRSNRDDESYLHDDPSCSVRAAPA